MTENNSSLYLDKLSISYTARNMFNRLSANKSELLSKIHEYNEISKHLSEYPLFIECCNNIVQIIDHMKNNKLKDLKNIEKDQSENKYNEIIDFQNKVNDIKKFKSITLQDFLINLDNINYFMSKAGYFSDELAQEEDDDDI